MTDLLPNASVEPIKALHAELLRHARDIDALFHRAHRDHHEMSAIIIALSAITDALGQLDPSCVAVVVRPAKPMDEPSENEPRPAIDHELSDALERMTDLEVRELFVRRLAELGHLTRLSERAEG